LHSNLTPDVIRDRGFTVLAQYPNGIRQTNFFTEVEAKLSTEFTVPPHAVKNSLWDLSDRYPEFVTKKKLSYRDVRLYPTERLLKERRGNLDDFTEDVLRYSMSDEFKLLRLHMLALKLQEMDRFILFSEMEGVLNEVIYEGSILSPREMEALIGYKIALNNLISSSKELSKVLKGKGIEGELD